MKAVPIVGVLLLASVAHAASTTLPGGWHAAAGTVPEHVQIIVETARPQFFLGENILIHFGVKNTGTESFHVDVGGDYRGATRALRFAVSAVGPDGKEAADPDPSGFCMGGISTSPEVKPGQTFWLSVPLIRYAKLDQAGEYTITIHHDLGWKETPDRKIPAGTIKLTLAMPDAKQAAAVVDAMAALKDDNWTYGEKRKEFADFSALRYPVYLPILVAAAQGGDSRALGGIGVSATPEATAALVKFLEAKDANLALTAAQMLTMRLPDPDFAGQGPRRGAPFIDPRQQQRQELSQAAWRAEHAGAVRAAALVFLKGDSQRIDLGAFMLECVGTSDDLESVVAALNTTVRASKDRTWEPDAFPSAPANANALERAVAALIRRGAPAGSTKPSNPGQCVAFVTALADERYRPAGWADTVAAMLRSDIPYVRQAALAKVPRPVPAAMLDRLPVLIAEPDLGVQYKAIELAGQAKHAASGDAVLTVLKQTNRHWVLNAADNAAYALGLHAQRWEIWIDRLDEPGLAAEAMQRLAPLIEGCNGGGSFGKPTAQEAQRVKPLWQAFYRAHREEILAGKRFAVGVITPDMIPAPISLSTGANGQWPDRNSKK